MPTCDLAAAHRRRLSVAAVLLAGVSLAGCGTRVKTDPATSVAGGTPAATSGVGEAPASSALGAPETEALSGRPPAVPAATTEATGTHRSAAPAASSRAAVSGAGATPRSESTRSGPAPTEAGGGADAPARPDGTGATPTPGLGPTPPSGSGGELTPVIVASIGTISGPAGSTFLGYVQGVQVWTKFINGRGGLNGHPVRLITYDDGGDPARHRAQVQEAVERQKVIAFVANTEALTGQSSIEYITKNRIPVIGGDTGTPHFYNTSPMYFPQASNADANWLALLSGMAAQTVPKGMTKLGLLYCVEADGCASADRIVGQRAGSVGFERVWRNRSSIAQPDYTAECLSARNAGVQVLMVIMDTNSVSRVASACARQGFHPAIAPPANVVLDRYKSDPNLNGLVTGANVFPYFQTGTLATDEYQRAMQVNGAGVAPSMGPATGWVAAKLLERAAQALPQPPTSEAILRGLWSLRGDDLGGLTQPLTFRENQPATALACWWQMAIQDGKWVSPDGFRRQCRDL